MRAIKKNKNTITLQKWRVFFLLRQILTITFWSKRYRSPVVLVSGYKPEIRVLIVRGQAPLQKTNYCRKSWLVLEHKYRKPCQICTDNSDICSCACGLCAFPSFWLTWSGAALKCKRAVKKSLGIRSQEDGEVYGYLKSSAIKDFWLQMRKIILYSVLLRINFGILKRVRHVEK